jgi:hypothetical protein
LVGCFAEKARSAGALLAMLDSTISLSRILASTYGDSCATRTPLAPCVVVTLATGVAGPLMYLLHREARSLAPAVRSN